MRRIRNRKQLTILLRHACSHYHPPACHSHGFDLPEAFIAKLKALHILYDEDESGGFLHFYGTVFGNGLFFEFVERRDGYDEFGAPNAPFRMAAQRRMAANAPAG